MAKKKETDAGVSKSEIPTIKTKDRYCNHLTPEENQMLDIIADIVTKHVVKKAENKSNNDGRL